jgi:hypothetical protein
MHGYYPNRRSYAPNLRRYKVLRKAVVPAIIFDFLLLVFRVVRFYAYMVVVRQNG